MTKKTRWADRICKEAAELNHAMPWERGARRAAMIARRLDTDRKPAKITLPHLPEDLTRAVSF